MTRLLPVGSWYHDLCSCLQVDVACVLRFHGWDPLQALGAAWRFDVRPGTCEAVEFYLPCPDGDVASALVADQPLHARWHRPVDAADAAAQLVAAIDAGRPPIVAVDNYHLPFRPAFGDVHAAHLVVVPGYRDDGVVHVLDPMPPAFDGTLPGQVLDTSRSAVTVADEDDPFFAGGVLGRRWLEVHPTGPQPALTREWLEQQVRRNLAALGGTAHGDPGRLVGLAGFGDYVRGLPRRVESGRTPVLHELYVLGWWAQAAAALHGEFLARAGHTLGLPRFAEVGRLVARVAHEWTGLRITAAHALGSTGPAEPLGHELLARGRRVVLAWEEATDRLGGLLRSPAALAGGPA